VLKQFTFALMTSCLQMFCVRKKSRATGICENYVDNHRRPRVWLVHLCHNTRSFSNKLRANQHLCCISSQYINPKKRQRLLQTRVVGPLDAFPFVPEKSCRPRPLCSVAATATELFGHCTGVMRIVTYQFIGIEAPLTLLALTCATQRSSRPVGLC
jgi:hypothetical protein